MTIITYAKEAQAPNLSCGFWRLNWSSPRATILLISNHSHVHSRSELKHRNPENDREITAAMQNP
jgi:hypothetical protein